MIDMPGNTTRRRTVVALVAALVLVTAGIYGWSRRVAEVTPRRFPRGLPPCDVFKQFAETCAAHDIEGFEHWARELSTRRLLAGRTSENIEELLGPPDEHRWTYLDSSVGDSMNPLKHLFSRKADYWVYGFYHPETGETVGFGVAFHWGALQWTDYCRKKDWHVREGFKTDYSGDEEDTP